MASIILTATWLRFWQLPNLPPGFSYDEAYNAMDGYWLLMSQQPQIYFPGNIGRPIMMPILAAISMGLFGITPYAVRLVSALSGVFLVALTYRWVITLFRDDGDRYWLGLLAAVGATFSMWHVVLSRNALEVMLVPLCLVGMTYLFWQGWLKRSWGYFGGAGLTLGLSQYTYQSATLIPVVLTLFVLVWTGAVSWLPVKQRREDLKTLWIGLGIVAAVSLVIFIPLGLYILKDSTTFFLRIQDVSVFNRIARGEAAGFSEQLLHAIRLFIDDYSPNWRHNIVGEPSFDWLSRLGFWIGLGVLIYRWRQPAALFLLVGLFVMWWPVLLSEGISAPRLSGLLPIYYTIAAVGLLKLTVWSARRLAWTVSPLRLRLGLIVLVFILSGSRNSYDFFVRWANEYPVYLGYYGPTVDLIEQVKVETQTADVFLPFEVYAQPTARFLLAETFREISTAPNPSLRPAVLVKIPQITTSSLVWLTHNEVGEPVAYICHPQLPAVLDSLAATGQTTPLLDPYHHTIAWFTHLPSIAPLFRELTDWHSLKPVNYDWGHEIQLRGYEIWPERVGPHPSSLTLNLYWQPLINQPHAYTSFIQVVNGRGEPIAQWTDRSLSDQHRWHAGTIISDQHTLWLGPHTVPGPYLVRMGLFYPSTGERLPIYNPDGAYFADQLFLGLFYVIDKDTDPLLPQVLLRARLGENIELLGYSDSLVTDKASSLQVQLHWQVQGKISSDYTIFVQLLDEQGNIITSWDMQPLAGQYPTSRWQPHEIVMDTFTLPLPREGLPTGEYRLVTGMYDGITGQRLSVFDTNEQLVPDNMIILDQIIH